MKLQKIQPYFLLIFISLTSTFAFADTIGNDEITEKCKNSDDASIKQLVADLDEIDQLLPTVPPEEIQYLKAESARRDRSVQQETQANSSVQINSNIIQAQLVQRKYYAVWRLREEIGYAREMLGYVLLGKTEIAKAKTIANSLAIFFDYQNEALEFKWKNKIYVPQVNQNKISYSATFLPLAIRGYLQCKLAKAISSH